MKFILDHYLLISVALASGIALLFPVLMRVGKTGSPTEITLLINRGKTTILDVRDPAEFAAGHLREAKNIPLAELAKRHGELKAGQAVVVICQSGKRSGLAARVLKGAGFEDITSLEGGMSAWTAAGLPTVK